MTCKDLAKLLMRTPDEEIVLSDNCDDHFRPVASVENVTTYHEPGYPQYMEDYKKREHWLTKNVRVLRSW